MAIYGISNQLIQIDTGKVKTYLYNPSVSLNTIYAGLGENQILGQRYASLSVGSNTASNPAGAPGYYILVKYQSTANPAPVNGPAPVYWTDATYTTVTGVSTEAALGLQGIAGYLMPNTTDIPSLTATQLNGATCLIQVGGLVLNAIAPASTVAGDWIIAAAGNFTPARVAQGTAAGYKTYGVAQTAVASGLCNILLNCDII